MPDPRYPTLDEFWQRLDRRDVEPDLRAALLQRAARASASVRRVGRQDTVVAVMERLLPEAAVPAPVLAAFVDEWFDQPLGRGDERHSAMPRPLLIPTGFALLDSEDDGAFASLSASDQDAMLARAEAGAIVGPEGFDSALWFRQVRDLALLGFASDPRGMVQMGYPGPSYKPGHVWLDAAGTQARADRRRGHTVL